MNAAALDSGRAAVYVSSTQGSAALARRALQRSGELELLDPHARRHLHIRLQLRAQLRVRRRQVLRTECTPSERESSFGPVRLTMMVLSPPSASTAVTAPPSRLISSFCTGSTACETPPATAKRHCQVKHKRVGVFWFRCSNNKVFQSRHQVQSDTQPKPQGVQRILATGLGLTPPGSLSRMRSLQPFSSQ